MDDLLAEPVPQETLGKRKRNFVNEHEDEGFDESADGADANMSASDEAGNSSDGSDNDSDEEDDDDDETNSKYKEESEPFPDEPAYDGEVSSIQEGCTNIASEIEAFLSQSDCSTEAVTNFQAKAAELKTFPNPDPIKVGMLGATGVGKSATTSALADVPGLAKEGAMGRACTCVATELGPPLPNQEKRLAARVQYIDKDSMRELLTEQLQNYEHWKLKDQVEWTSEDRTISKESSDTAMSTLKALFNNQDEFESNESATEFVDGCLDDIEGAVDTMLEWCQEELTSGDDSEDQDNADEDESRPHVKTFQGHKASKLRKLIDPLMCSKQTYTEPSLWPLVDQVDIGIRGSRVLQHLTIDCDALWIVARIDRVVTDPDVSRLVVMLLQKYGERFAGKVAIICTRSDDFETYIQAKGLKSEGYDLGNWFSRWKEATRLKKALDKAEAALAKAQSQPKPGKYNIGSLSNDMLEKQNEYDTLMTHLHTCIVRLRNYDITEQLREKYGEHIPEGCELQVFCISNKHYAAAKGIIHVKPPLLAPEDTNIPALRRYALKLAAPTLMRNLEGFVNHKFTVFMKGLELWAHGSSVKSPEELRKIVAQPQYDLPPKIEDFVTTTNDLAEDVILKPFEKLQPDMITAAEKEIQRWNGWHWCTIKSFVKKNGTHSTTLAPNQSWNKTFQRIAIDQIIKPGWKTLYQSRAELFESMARGFDNGIQELFQVLAREPDAQSLPLFKFNEVLRAHRYAIQELCMSHQRDYVRGLANIKIKACGVNEDAYFSKAMEECYDQCKKISGSGYRKNIISHFQIHLGFKGKRSPFHDTAKRITEAVKQNARSTADAFLKDLNGILAQIVELFEVMIKSREDDDPSELPVKRMLAEILEKRKDEVEGMSTSLEMIKARYEGAVIKEEEE